MNSPDDYGIKNYKFSVDKTIDVEDYVDLSNMELETIPFKFGNIYGIESKYSKKGGFFNIYNNRLSNLYGSPQIVYGNFICSNNLLTTFEGGPQIVYGHFASRGNPTLTSTIGLPNHIHGDLYLDNHIDLGNYPLSIIEGTIYCDKKWSLIFNNINNTIKNNREMFFPFLGNRSKVLELAKLLEK